MNFHIGFVCSMPVALMQEDCLVCELFLGMRWIDMPKVFSCTFYRPHPKDGEGNVFSLSVSSHLEGGGGTYLPGRGVPTFPGLDGGVPTFPGLDRGGTYLPGGGVSTWVGNPPPHQGRYPPPHQGRYPPTRTAWHVLATRRAVCLLRSRRRTFLLIIGLNLRIPAHIVSQ